MFFDTKSVLLGLALLTAPLFASAQQKFPFDITRDANGTLTRIELPLRHSVTINDEDVLSTLRSSLKDYQSTSTVGMTAVTDDQLIPQTDDDKKIYEQAKAYLKTDLSAQAVNDARLDGQYTKAKAKILQVKLFRLLAAPSNVDAFDREKAVADVLKEVLSEGEDLLGISSPAFKVFEFLVDQYITALEDRRAFYQNELMVLMEYQPGLFTEKEKSLIRSSVYYSRLDFTDLFKRNDARKDWNNYGDSQLDAQEVPCKGFVASGETSWGACFKQVGNLYENRMIQKSVVSSSPSLAFDQKNPHRVRDFRALMILARLGVHMVPVPSLAKKPLEKFIDSQYVDQRKAEGFFFGYSVLRGQTDLGNWILDSSANPIIRK